MNVIGVWIVEWWAARFDSLLSISRIEMNDDSTAANIGGVSPSRYPPHSNSAATRECTSWMFAAAMPCGKTVQSFESLHMKPRSSRHSNARRIVSGMYVSVKWIPLHTSSSDCLCVARVLAAWCSSGYAVSISCNCFARRRRADCDVGIGADIIEKYSSV